MPFAGEITRADIVARIEAHSLGDTPGAMRQAFARLVNGDGPPAPPPGVRVSCDETLVVQPDDTDPDRPPVVWFHGGGYVFGSPETHLRPAYHLARHHGMTVLLPRYRLAPEHPWPAQLDDAHRALDVHPAPIVAGDSAGGHLALVAASERPVAALLLFSPNTDRTGRSPTRKGLGPFDPMVDDAGDARLAAMCFGDRPGDDPQVSPTLGDLSRMPPTYLEVGSPEVLLGDAALLGAAADRQGATVKTVVTPGLLHMGQLWAPWWAEARASLDRAARFARRVT
ncbi:MAG: alpha/beta hydrolase fold domain-containing protein [Pseudomonadota bacterium]